MTLQTFKNQLLKPVGLSFYKKQIEEKKFMIWINNWVAYYTSKFINHFVSKFWDLTNKIASTIIRSSLYLKALENHQNTD